MTNFAKFIRPYVENELLASQQARLSGDPLTEFRHLERAHVLGQPDTFLHTRVHWRMLLWGLRQRNSKEVFGQSVRVVGAITKTFIGLVPTGNTGGSNVSAVQPMPIDEGLAAILERARDPTR